MLERQRPIQRLYQLLLILWVIISLVFMRKQLWQLLPTHVRRLIVTHVHAFKYLSDYLKRMHRRASTRSRNMPPEQTHTLSPPFSQTIKNNILDVKAKQDPCHMRLPMYGDLSILQVRLQSEQINQNTPSLSHEQKNLSTLKSPTQEPSWFP